MTDKHPPRKIINYPISGDPKGGALYLYGDANAKNVALLSAGFADDHAIFLPFASRLAVESSTLVGVTCLPGYDDREDKAWTEHKTSHPSGYSFPEMAATFREAAKALRSESSHTSSKPKLTGIFHDWGVIPGAIWANKSLEDSPENAPDELVYFDVLPDPHPETIVSESRGPKIALTEIIAGIYYQLVLAFSFMIQRYVGNIFAVMSFTIGFLPLSIFPFIAPLCQIDMDVINAKQSTPSMDRILYMAYPYFNIWRLGIRKMKSFVKDQSASLPKDLTRTPVLYLYGTEKNAQWHKRSAVKHLQRQSREKKSKSNAIAVENAGHYLYIQKPDFCLECVKNFIKDK